MTAGAARSAGQPAPGARPKIRPVRARVGQPVRDRLDRTPFRPLTVPSESPGPFVASSLQQDDAMRYRLDIHTDERARQKRLETDVREGLTAWQKSLPPKYFYDRAGSLLFERITELPEYYPTRTEAALLGEIVPGLIGEILPADIGNRGWPPRRRPSSTRLPRAGGRPLRAPDVDWLPSNTRPAHAGLPLSIHAVVEDSSGPGPRPPHRTAPRAVPGQHHPAISTPRARGLLAGLRAPA
jgi:hypothetical protein